MQNKKTKMAKTKKQQKHTQLHTQSNEKKKWTKEKILKTIGLWAVMLLVAIPCWALLGVLSSRLYGYNSSQVAIENTLLAIQDNDKSKIAKSFCSSDKNADEIMTQLQNYAKSVKGTYSIKLDSSYTKYDEKELDTTTLNDTIGFTPDNAKYTIAGVESSQTRNDKTYNGICVYEIITYEYKDKWYISSLSELGYEILDMEYTPVSTNMVGSNSLGYIGLDTNSWSQAKTENSLFDDTETMYYQYKGTDHNSSIILSAIYDGVTTDEAIEKILSVFEEDERYVCINTMDTTLNGTTYKKIMSVYVNDDGTSVTMYTWLYKNILKDPYLHQITLTTTNSEATYPIILTYAQ